MAGVYLDLDAAWEAPPHALPRFDARGWGPLLRCFAPRAAMRRFIDEVVSTLPRFVLFGSGDFHHLTAALLTKSTAPNIVVFDNHPDWDRRPPHWACGGWVNRAFDFPHVKRIAVWGCGNFELNWPSRAFGNHRAEVFSWRERYPKRGNISRDDWRAKFQSFAGSLHGGVYVSVDMDCFADAITNWENGLFTADDVAWAIGRLPEVAGGDICGAYSPPVYARRRQRFAAEWDHPKLPPRDIGEARAINARIVETLWPALTRR